MIHEEEDRMYAKEEDVALTEAVNDSSIIISDMPKLRRRMLWILQQFRIPPWRSLQPRHLKESTDFRIHQYGTDDDEEK